MLPASKYAFKYCGAVVSFVAIVVCSVFVTRSDAQSTKESPGHP
jgi:hypothetical protein